MFSLPVNLYGQQIFSESDVLGKYYWNDNLNQVGKTIIIFKKNGKYIEKINKYYAHPYLYQSKIMHIIGKTKLT